jgi:hypothetical protein
MNYKGVQSLIFCYILLWTERTFQESRPIEKNKIENLPARCGIVALETRELQIITNEKPISINFSLTKWEDLFSFLGVILTKWETLSATRSNLGPYKERIKKLRDTNTAGFQAYVTKLEEIATEMAEKFDASEKSFKITFEPFSLQYEKINPRITEMKKIVSDDTHAVGIADLELVTEIFTLFQFIKSPAQFLHELIPDITAALFALAEDPECLLTTANAIEWAAIIIEERLSKDTFHFKFPCLPAKNLFQEYRLISFPTVLNGQWMRSAITDTLYWLADNNNTIYGGNEATLHEYDDDLLHAPIYTLDAVPKKAINQFAENLFRGPFKQNNVECPNMESFYDDVTELITLGNNELLYFSNYVTESIENALDFQCNSKPFTQKITPGISLINLDETCILQHLPTTVVHDAKFVEEETEVFYIPEQPGKINKVEPKGFQFFNDDQTTTVRAKKIFVYIVCGLIVFGLLAFAKCNITTIYKIGRHIVSLYTHFRHHPVNTEPENIDVNRTANRMQVLAPFIM